MAQILNADHSVFIILVQLLLFTVINAQNWAYNNETDHDPSQASERLKRAPFHRYIPPDILRATIKDGDNEIHLTWRRVERYLFNKNLPVYTARMNSWGPNHRKSDVMNIIGDTIIYHDVAHKSTIMYVENMDRLNGVVGRNYEITNLPIDKLSQPLEADGEYVIKLLYYPHGEKKRKRKMVPRCLDFSVKKIKLNSGEASTSSIQSRRDTLSECFYIETLLFVTYDVFQFFKSKFGDDFMKALVFNYLFHFNAVDMVFAHLPADNFKIYINLAGIIIEEEDGVFSAITNYLPLKYNNEPELHADSYIFQHFDRYSDHFDFPFPRDSFDFIVISTGRELHYGEHEHAGWNLNVIDIFEAKRHNNGHAYVPMAMVSSIDTYSSYCVLAHEIGNILGMDTDDPPLADITDTGIQCYGIMQTSKHHCTECMKWRNSNIRQLHIFLSQHRNRCSLLNKPRSLHPSGTPIIFISPCRQCTCFQYRSYAKEDLNECPLSIPAKDCGEPLQCIPRHSEGRLKPERTILPFDGTPCGENGVCWGEKCVNRTQTTSNSIL